MSSPVHQDHGTGLLASAMEDRMTLFSSYRQKLITMTAKNNHATLMETHAAWNQCVEAILHVRGMAGTLVLQPLLPAMAGKGQRG